MFSLLLALQKAAVFCSASSSALSSGFWLCGNICSQNKPLNQSLSALKRDSAVLPFAQAIQARIRTHSQGSVVRWCVVVGSDLLKFILSLTNCVYSLKNLPDRRLKATQTGNLIVSKWFHTCLSVFTIRCESKLRIYEKSFATDEYRNMLWDRQHSQDIVYYILDLGLLVYLISQYFSMQFKEMRQETVKWWTGHPPLGKQRKQLT